MKIVGIALLFFLPAFLFGEAASPLIRPGEKQIIDVGFPAPERPTTADKVWRQYEATYEDVAEAIIGKHRIYSDPELCLSDEDYVENCPIGRQACDEEDERTDGWSELYTSEQYFDAIHSEVDECEDNSTTRCLPFHYEIPQNLIDDAVPAYEHREYDFEAVLDRYCEDGNYTLHPNINGSEACYIEDHDKRQFSEYTEYYQCYLGDGNVSVPEDRLECGSLYDWQHMASQYYGGAIYDNGTQEDSCVLSTVNPEWGRWCGTLMRTVTGCSDNYTVVPFWYESNADDKAASCLHLMDVQHVCPLEFTYDEYGDICLRFREYSYDCPSGYGDLDADHMCHKYSYGCPEGYEGPDENETCVKDGYDRYKCEENQEIQEIDDSHFQCRAEYFYYEYLCPDDLNLYELRWEIIDEGGDCGGCGYVDCYCNDEFPPANNCHRLRYECPFDENRPCTELATENDGELYTNKPMKLHPITGGDFVGEEYGHLRESGCGTECDFAVNVIAAEGNTLSFSNRTGNHAVFAVEDCSFEGKIDAGDSRNIAAIKTSGGSDPHALQFYDDAGDSLGIITSTCPVNGGVSFRGANFNIISVSVKHDQLWFWDSYNDRGDIGLVEFVKEMYGDDGFEGYRPTPAETFWLRATFFDRIFYLEENEKSYAISSRPMTQAICDYNSYHGGFTRITQDMVDDDEVLAEMVENYLGSLDTIDAVQESATCFGNEDAGGLYDEDLDLCTRSEPVCHMDVDFHTTDGHTHYEYNVSVPREHNEFEPDNLYYRFFITNECTFYAQPLYAPDNLDWSVGIINPPNHWSWSFYGLATADLRSSDVIESDNLVCPANALYRSGPICFMPSEEGATCVLERDGDYSFARTSFSRKPMEQYADEKDWFCSPYVCKEHICQTAECFPGYYGSIIPEDLGNPPNPGDCMQQVCDANQPYYEFCGKEKPCPTELPDVVMTTNGCKRVVCQEGGYNENDGMCYKWQCPANTHEEGDTCVYDD